MPVDDTILAAWRSDLSGHQTFWVLLTAPLPILEVRDRQRSSGQHLGNARGHYQLSMTSGYDLRRDTNATDPQATALAIKDRHPF